MTERWESTPIINYVFEWSNEESETFQDELSAMHGAHRNVALNAYKRNEWKGPVGFYKAVLGRQNYTWVGSRRFWVWEGENWRIYVGNTHGTSFEVATDLTKEQVVAAWNDFRARIGLFSPYVVGDKVLVYANDEKGTFKELDENYPGHCIVALDSGKKTSVHFDNLMKSESV